MNSVRASTAEEERRRRRGSTAGITELRESLVLTVLRLSCEDEGKLYERLPAKAKTDSASTG
jgi:hypothetical protein